MADQVALLEQHPDAAAPAGAARSLLGAARQPLAVDAHHAAVGLVEAGQAGQQRRLARAGRPGDRDDLAALDGERHALQRERLVVAGVEEPVQAARLEHGVIATTAASR